jgi:cytochrome c-type biogenesis protein
MQVEVSNNQSLAPRKARNRAYLFIHALAFVFGFSLVFVIGWGGAATVLGQLFVDNKIWIARIGGLVLIIFGFATMDIIHISWFNMDTRQQYKGKTGTFWGSLAMGIFFAAGWSPCIGATLGAILTLGFSSATVGQAMYLSFAYSIGLGIPFLLLALLVDQAIPIVKRLRKHLRVFQIFTGALIITIGILMITAQMTAISRWALQSGFYLDFPSSGRVPGMLTAMLAGALSFLSPCVLPLVPAYLGYLSGQALATTKYEINEQEVK